MSQLTSPKRKNFIKKSRIFITDAVNTFKASTRTLPQENKTESFSCNDYQDTRLHSFAMPYIDEHVDQSGFYPLGDGKAAYITRLAMIESAQKCIDIQYYLYGDDETSQLITWYLFQAAERGVRIRLLLDDMQKRNDNHLASLGAHPNIEVRLFNPFVNRKFKSLGFLYDFKRVNHRMHNKVIISDGSFAITGGRNVGDEYFSADLDVNFGDFDLLLVGKIIPEIATQFDQYWNYSFAVPIENLVSNISLPTNEELEAWHSAQEKYLLDSEYAKSLSVHPLVQQLACKTLPFNWSNASFHYDSPSKVSGCKEHLLIDDLSLAIAKAEKEFVLVSPYFVPTKKGADLLAKKAKEGVKVTVVTNSLASNDVFAVHGWYAKYRNILLESGVQLYETKLETKSKIKRSFIQRGRSSLHAKSFIVDTNKVFVGSFNFDPRSMFINTEMGVFVDSAYFVDLFNENLDYLLNKTSYRLSLNEKNKVQWHDDANKVVYNSEPDSGIWLRMGSWIAGILPIESQL